MSKLTKEQEEWMELEKLTAELEAEAIQMRIDYEENPSDSMNANLWYRLMSGFNGMSVI